MDLLFIRLSFTRQHTNTLHYFFSGYNWPVKTHELIRDKSNGLSATKQKTMWKIRVNGMIKKKGANILRREGKEKNIWKIRVDSGTYTTDEWYGEKEKYRKSPLLYARSLTRYLNPLYTYVFVLAGYLHRYIMGIVAGGTRANIKVHVLDV